MTVKIKTINIHAFRGVLDLELQLDGKSLLLHGENGTGKSSIVEAIEFFFTGKISSLEGIQGLSMQRHGPHVNFKPNDVYVEMTFNPGSVILRRTFELSPSPPERFKEYFQITQKGTFILRRSQILTFIMSTPANRFRAIGSILGVESLDKIELEMKRVSDNLKGKIDSIKEKIDGLIKDLSAIVERDIANIEDVLLALNNMLQKASLPLINSLEDIEAHAEEMLKTVKKAKNIDQVKVLNEIWEETKGDIIAKDIIYHVNEINDKIKFLLQEDIRLKLPVADLLRDGRSIVEEMDMDVCPLCEQEIDRKKLLSKIDARIKTLRNLSEDASKVRTMGARIKEGLDVIINKVQSINSKLQVFPELSEEKDNIRGQIAFLKEFTCYISDIISDIENIKGELLIQQFVQSMSEIKEVMESISIKCMELLNAIGLTEDEKKMLEVVRMVEQVRSKAIELSRAQNEIKFYKTLFNRAEKIFLVFSEAKKMKMQEIYESIQGNIQKFYLTLHPNDLHKNIELTVKSTRRASTEISVESFGRKGEDPRAFTSEGHLDSLGLCIFLGFAKKFNKGCSLIVLDDVVSTVDAKHRENVCKLLFEEFRDNQLVITTHDEVWYEQLRYFQQAYGMEGNFNNKEIVDWDLETGPRIRPYKTQWERIQDSIAARDKTGAGNKGRQYLEWVLEKICEVTEAPVPFKRSGRYGVEDLLIPAERRVKDLLKEDTLKDEILDAFRKLKSTIYMGNILSHNNILAKQVSIEEVDSFCKSVHNLHNLFLCSSCSRFIRYYRDLGIMSCENPRCKNPVKWKTK